MARSEAQSSAVPGRDVAERFFEPQMRALGLSIEQIDAQTPDELRESLRRADEAIANAAGYDTLSIKMTADSSALIAKVRSDAHFTFSIVPFLLERKRLILTRIREL